MLSPKVCTSCTNSALDGLETAVDCGGGECGSCHAGSACELAGDCVSGQCEDGQRASCFNNVSDGYETGVDCGGPTCSERCGVGDNTTDGKCDNITALCHEETASEACSNGVQDNYETATDCGGSVCTSVSVLWPRQRPGRAPQREHSIASP